LRVPDFLRTTVFRQSLMIAAFFTASSLIVSAIVYWETVAYASAEVDHEVVQTANAIGKVPVPYMGRRLNRWLTEEMTVERYGLLLDADGAKLAGNMDRMPDGAVLDGQAHTLHTRRLDGDPRHADDVVRGVAMKTPDGRTLLVAMDTDEWERFRDVVLRSLALGLIPTLALACLAGALFGRAILGRLAAMDAAINRITHGDLSERLPRSANRPRDELDRLAGSVNVMLDDLQHLLLDVQAVGDSIAHDLRTPMTRMRTRLEIAKAKAWTADQLRAAIDEAMHWLDQTLGVITAVLRIGEIEHGRRRAAFRAFDAADVLREVHELMEPLAEEKGVTLGLSAGGAGAVITGDRELVLEALINLVDNAIKFTPVGGRCLIGLGTQAGVSLRVEDSGPGIPETERQAVLRRFYKASAHRHSDGSGLGLALVAAVARLHDFDLSITDSHPGCTVELRVPGGGGLPTPAHPAKELVET
jgi:signal transduction histidine kinase